MLSSIKARVITFYLAVLFVTLSALGIFLYLSLGKIVYDSIDSGLLSRAKALATLIKEADAQTEFNFSDEIMWEYHSPKAGSFFQIRRLDGAVIEKSTSLGERELPFLAGENRTRFNTILLNGTPVRVVNFHILKDRQGNDKEKSLPTKYKRDGLIIQCAEIIRGQITLIRNYGLVLAISIFLVMMTSGSGAFFIARKALMPIKEISATAGRISESNLSERIGVEDTPSELRALSASFNHTFDRLENSFKRQKQFTSDASHELRTPLSVILSQSEITLRRERTPGEYRNALMTVEEAGKLMSDIVTKLLTIARLGADKAEIKKERIDLTESISVAVKLLSPYAENNHIKITMYKTGTPLLIEGDRAAILELFINIIDNGIKYNIPHGKIAISFKKEDAFIVVQVKDTGVGIAEGDLNQVFERFYRVDKSRSKHIAGIGLGLSICREIVRLHGGRITMERQVGGGGTTVSVYLKKEA
jgi:two-component system, OmpR family, sensor histidine kinase ArlS